MTPSGVIYCDVRLPLGNDPNLTISTPHIARCIAAPPLVNSHIYEGIALISALDQSRRRRENEHKMGRNPLRQSHKSQSAPLPEGKLSASFAAIERDIQRSDHGDKQRYLKNSGILQICKRKECSLSRRPLVGWRFKPPRGSRK